jgi:hypothetical protein
MRSQHVNSTTTSTIVLPASTFIAVQTSTICLDLRLLYSF